MQTSFRSFGLLFLCCGMAACAAQNNPPAATLSGTARLGVAQAAERSGDYGLSDSLYAAASREAPTDAAVQLRYADSLVRSGRLREARSLLMRHMGKVSDPQRLRAGLAALNILAGDPESALREYGKLLAAKPDDMRYVVDKAVALDLLGHHDEAQLLYRRALSVLPDDPAVISDLALSLLLSGKRAEASSVIAPLRDADDLLPRLRNNVDVILAALPSASGSAPANASEDADGMAIQQIAQALNAAPRTAALEPR